MEKCNHDLENISSAMVFGATSSLSGGKIFWFAPYFKCKECKKIFAPRPDSLNLFEVSIIEVNK